LSIKKTPDLFHAKAQGKTRAAKKNYSLCVFVIFASLRETLFIVL